MKFDNPDEYTAEELAWWSVAETRSLPTLSGTPDAYVFTMSRAHWAAYDWLIDDGLYSSPELIQMAEDEAPHHDQATVQEAFQNGVVWLRDRRAEGWTRKRS